MALVTVAPHVSIKPSVVMESFHPALKDLEQLGELPSRLQLDSTVLSKRRCTIAGCGDTPPAMPRMKRRGAISYESDDSFAQYLRCLGRRQYSKTVRVRVCIARHCSTTTVYIVCVSLVEALAKREENNEAKQLVELPTNERKFCTCIIIFFTKYVHTHLHVQK